MAALVLAVSALPLEARLLRGRTADPPRPGRGAPRAVDTAVGLIRRRGGRGRRDRLPRPASGFHPTRRRGPGRPSKIRLGMRAADVDDVHLTGREREVLMLLAQGLQLDEIAHRLGIGPETVRTHVRKASDRLGAANRTHAVAIAIRRRLI